jgi:hypothetical protein
VPSRSSPRVGLALDFDLVLALVGWFLLLLVPVSVAADAVSLPAFLADVSELVLVAVLAVPIAAWYWWTDRPIGLLGAWFFWTVALTLALGLPLLLILGAFDAAPTTASYPARALGVGFVAVVYALAYGVASRRGGGREPEAKREGLDAGSK